MRQNPSSVDDEREISRRIPYIKLWVAQFHALMFKNFSLIRHSIVLSLSLVTIPALVTLLFNFDNATPSDFLFNFGPFSRESYGNTPLTCNGISECTFVLFSPSLDSNIENIMRNFASRLDLDVNNEKHIKGFQNFNQLGSYIQENPGKFATGKSFIFFFLKSSCS